LNGNHKGGEHVKLKKIDSVVKRETLYIAMWTLIFSVLMEAVFLIGGWFDYRVPLGNLLGGTAAVLNFFLMGVSVQIAVEKDRAANDYSNGADEADEAEEASSQRIHKEAKQVMKISQMLRNFMLIGFCAAGAAAPCFNLVAVLVPLLFPRIAVMLRPMFLRREEASKGGEN